MSCDTKTDTFDTWTCLMWRACHLHEACQSTVWCSTCEGNKQLIMDMWDSDILHEGCVLSALSQALFDHIVLYECVYLMPQSKTHVVFGLQLSVDCSGENPLQCCVARLLLWDFCCETSVVACLHAQTGQRSRHKVLSCGGITDDWGHSLWLPFFFFCHAMLHVFGTFYCLFNQLADLIVWS